MLVSEFRSQLDLQLADEDDGIEVAPERKDNASFCKTVSLVMNASYFARKRDCHQPKKINTSEFPELVTAVSAPFSNRISRLTRV
jgi:hypothetical protein